MSVPLHDILAELRDAAAAAPGFVELRYHHHELMMLMVRDGDVLVSTTTQKSGVHVRVAERGVWGAAVAAELSATSLASAIARAHDSARAAGTIGGAPLASIIEARSPRVLARGVAAHRGIAELAAMQPADKLSAMHQLATDTRRASSRVASVVARYRELVEHRAVVTSDGACAAYSLVRPDAVVMVTAMHGGESVTLGGGAGVAGGWTELWSHPAMVDLAGTTAQLAVDLLAAPAPAHGYSEIVLSPSLTGVLCHEAVGHLLEYDVVHGASIAQGARGHRIGSEHVTVLDLGMPADDRAAGYLPFDDEGVIARQVVLVEQGRIAGYLHDSATSALEGDLPTGNARSWTATDAPLIRMRNTCLVPGDASVDELVAATRDGYLFAGNGGGQSESNGSIAITASYGWRIRGGRKAELVRGTTLSGNTRDVLASIDQVSRDFEWGLGIDFCERGQPARCDAGGAHVRCQMEVAG